MGEGLGEDLIAYLDTHVAIWLAEGRDRRLSARVRALIERSEMRLSPMVLLELEYLHELGRVRLRARDILSKLEHELDVRLCSLPFAQIATAALDEKWTRDPFDRMIVAQARSNGLSPLISSDEEIAAHYPRTIA
ncbi:MAG TPA: PIN domain-containing protein [Terracidiphilus sp.]|nr:PIN domain-containing protein [Terracidiphilus sp.]